MSTTTPSHLVASEQPLEEVVAPGASRAETPSQPSEPEGSWGDRFVTGLLIWGFGLLALIILADTLVRLLR
jgi:hypothetical protein